MANNTRNTNIPNNLQGVMDMPDFGIQYSQSNLGYRKGGVVKKACCKDNSYQQGGMVGPNGAAVLPAGMQENTPPPENLSPDAMQMQINNVMQKDPEGMEQVKAMMLEGIQTGEITEQELNMLVQLATVAMQNPAMYPQIREYAIQQGLAATEDIPEEYDQGLVLAILLAAQTIQGVPQQPRPNMGIGGPLGDSINPDGSIPITAHEGEFVIPKNVVQAKGTDFFNKMIEPKE
jgi:hypothetical protein|tara:strand:+ start:444 stop:1142 length:699 start_codon:yes stop_codon:yes gene_type:complete